MKRHLIGVFLAVTFMWTAPGWAKPVDCDKTSLADAILQLKNGNPKPETLTVSGTCNESIVIQGIDDLTLIAEAGATITGGTPGVGSAVFIEHSQRVTVSGFNITPSSGTGVTCRRASDCALVDNIITQTGAGGAGVLVATEAYTTLSGNTISGFGTGLLVLAHGTGQLLGGGSGPANVIDSNGNGIQVLTSHLRIDGSSTDQNVISNSAGIGIFLQRGSDATINRAVVTVSGNNPLSVFSGGIVVDAANLNLFNSTVSFSNGHGILAMRGSDVRTQGNMITYSERSGLALTLTSTARPTGTTAFAFNGLTSGVDLFCDANSSVHSAVGAIAAISITCGNYFIDSGAPNGDGLNFPGGPLP